jgi:hypothetical protein
MLKFVTLDYFMVSPKKSIEGMAAKRVRKIEQS